MPTILITGATGFIGSHLVVALADMGYKIVCGVKSAPPESLGGFAYITTDYTRDFDMDVWKTRLADVDVVINAVGILREHGRQTFDALHDRAPRALFAACAAADVKVVQISALGADEKACSRYHLSKKAADDALFTLPNKSVIVQPSLVYGAGGTSARIFNLIASCGYSFPVGDSKYSQSYRDLTQPWWRGSADRISPACPLVGAATPFPEALFERTAASDGAGPRHIFAYPRKFRRYGCAGEWLAGKGLAGRGDMADASAGQHGGHGANPSAFGSGSSTG